MKAGGAGRVVATALLVVLSVSGCTPHPVGPARSDAAYEGKARTTVEGALSSAQTARLVVTADAEDRSTSTFTATVLSEQEEAIEALAGTFGSIQPHSASSDALGEEVDALLADAASHVRVARIAARRGGGEDLRETDSAIESDITALQRFLEEHPG